VEHLRQTAESMRRLGHQAEFLSLDRRDEPCLETWTSPVHPVGAGWTRYRFSRATEWLRRHARGYDAVFVHTLWRHLGAAVRSALRDTGVPYFLKPHGGLNAWHRGKRGGPLLKRVLKEAAWKTIEWKVVRDAAAVIFVCEDERRQAARSFRPYRPSREEVIFNGIGHPPVGPETQAEAFYAAYPDLRGRDLLLFLGRLHPDKACDNLVRGLARVTSRWPNVHVVMAGPDQLGWKAELVRIAEREGAARRLTWTGGLDANAKWAALRGASALILPSHTEAMPYSILEALSCRKPVLTTDRVGIVDDLRQARCGFIAPDTVEGTAESIERWASAGPAEREELAENAYALFSNGYHIDIAMERQLQLVRESKPSARSHFA